MTTGSDPAWTVRIATTALPSPLAGLPAGLTHDRRGPVPTAGGMISAAVLVPLYLSDEQRLRTILTVRHPALRHHGGEISFPGGRYDRRDSDLVETSLREAQEEIGLTPDDVTIIGALPPTSTMVTNYEITPFVGLIPAGEAWNASPREVHAVVDLDIEVLRSSRTRAEVTRRGITFQTDAYAVDDHLIWGATARILESLLELLVAPTPPSSAA